QKNLKPQKTINYSSVLERPRSFEIHNKTQFIKKITQQKLIKLDGGVFRAGAVSGQSVFFGTSKGNTFEIDRANNEIKREFYTGTFLTPGPLIWNNSLIIGEGTHDIHHARIYFYDLLTGKLTKSFTTKGHTEGQATIGTYKNKTLLFAVAGSDGVYALDPTSHDKDNNVSVKWHEIVGHTDASVAIADGVVFVGTGREKGNAEKYKTYAAAHEFNTGKLLWKRELPASSWMKPITISSLVCFVYGEVYFKSQLGGLQCFDQKSGEPKQSYHTTQPVITIPIRVGHRIYFSDLKGTIHAIDTKKKSILWRAKTKAAKGLAFAGLSYDEHRNVLVFASKKNGLFVFDPLSGKTIHNWVPKKEETEWKKTYASVTITKEGWWVADMKGNLRFLKLQFN
ncbi:MAG: PQQ-binding-like beta-propeller repeat protein, partial [Halobacteriovoraceae bacterium]|nr:PQQ-binding-like beta-propeller repeat protein [Halobacteriovoraceae bacterium]